MAAASSLLGAEHLTAALVLRQVTSGESDRVVTLLTASHGKVAAVARGAHKSRQRFGAALAPLVLGEARLRERRGSDLMWLEGFRASEDFTALSHDPVRWAHAAYVTELVRELSAPRQSDAPVFELLVDGYRALGSAPPSAQLLRAFELALYGALGLRPELARCLRCQATDDATLDATGAMLDPELGGVLCAPCARAARGPASRPLPAGARAHLMALQGLARLADAATVIAPTPADATAARVALHAVAAVHLPGPLRSLEFIDQLRHDPAARAAKDPA